MYSIVHYISYKWKEKKFLIEFSNYYGLRNDCSNFVALSTHRSYFLIDVCFHPLPLPCFEFIAPFKTSADLANLRQLAVATIREMTTKCLPPIRHATWQEKEMMHRVKEQLQLHRFTLSDAGSNFTEGLVAESQGKEEKCERTEAKRK